MIYEMAGYIGVNPDPFTFYELTLMVQGKRKEEWQHTASILAMVANTVRDPKKKRKAYCTEDFYPKSFDTRRKEVPMRVPISALKSAFIDNQHGNTGQNPGRRGGHPLNPRG